MDRFDRELEQMLLVTLIRRGKSWEAEACLLMSETMVAASRLKAAM